MVANLIIGAFAMFLSHVKQLIPASPIISPHFKHFISNFEPGGLAAIILAQVAITVIIAPEVF